MVSPSGSSGEKRNRRIHHLAAGGGHCRGTGAPTCGSRVAVVGRASWNAVMVLANPTIIELDMGKLEDLVARIDSHQLREEDFVTLHSLIESYVGLFFAVGNKNTTIARLRQMLFGARTERTAAVFKDDARDGASTAHLAGEVRSPDAAAPVTASGEVKGGQATTAEGGGETRHGDSPTNLPAASETAGANTDAPASTPNRRGHGRNGANAYTAAEKIDVPHASLQPGDPCPQCETGTVYDTGRPGVVVRLVGQPPVGAKVYSLQKLRCNPCGAVFTAELPPGAGGAKRDATVGSMIALLRYGTGMPFSRNETLQEGLGIPLPASTQWDIVADQAERAEPAFEEIVRQAAQADVVYHDDTSVKILAEMERQALAEDRVETCAVQVPSTEDRPLSGRDPPTWPQTGRETARHPRARSPRPSGRACSLRASWRSPAKARRSPCSSADISMPARTSRICWRGVRRTFPRRSRCVMLCRGTCRKD